MYTIAVTFTCFPGKREQFVDRVKAEGILDAIRAEDGCIRYDYYFSDKDAQEILLIEEWETQEHQRIHLHQPQMDALRKFKDDYVASTVLKEFEWKN